MNFGLLQGLSNALTSAGGSLEDYQKQKRQRAMEALQQSLMQSQLMTQAQERTLATQGMGLQQAAGARAEQELGLNRQRLGMEQTGQQDTQARNFLTDLPGEMMIPDQTAKTLQGTLYGSMVHPNQIQSQTLSLPNLQGPEGIPSGVGMPGAPPVSATPGQAVAPGQVVERGPMTTSDQNGWWAEPLVTPGLKAARESEKTRAAVEAERIRNDDLINQSKSDSRVLTAMNAETNAKRAADQAAYETARLAQEKQLRELENLAKTSVNDAGILKVAMGQAVKEATEKLDFLTDPEHANDKINARIIEIFNAMKAGAGSAFVGNPAKPMPSHAPTTPAAAAPSTGFRLVGSRPAP